MLTIDALTHNLQMAATSTDGGVLSGFDADRLAFVLLDLVESAVPAMDRLDPNASYGEQLKAGHGTKSHACRGVGFACDEPTCTRHHVPLRAQAAGQPSDETIGQRLARVALSSGDPYRIALAADGDRVTLAWLESRSTSGNGYPITVLHRILAALIDAGAAERDAAWRSAVAGSVPAATPPATPADVGQCVKRAEENAAGVAVAGALARRDAEWAAAVVAGLPGTSHSPIRTPDIARSVVASVLADGRLALNETIQSNVATVERQATRIAELERDLAFARAELDKAVDAARHIRCPLLARPSAL